LTMLPINVVKKGNRNHTSTRSIHVPSCKQYPMFP